MGKSTNDKNDAAIIDELVQIKKLLILELLRDGASQTDIAKVLGVNQSSISRMIPGSVQRQKTM